MLRVKKAIGFVLAFCLIFTMITVENVFEIGANTTLNETVFLNCQKLLEKENRLTIGYIGGSITYGASAINNGGSIELSYVNRVSNWFKEKYQKATIETVNAGVSDTATNFGVFRLEKTLMNTNGHDMPDLVFVEFTVNDWTYSTQSVDDLKRQVESVFLNIWQINPYAEIAIIITATSENSLPRKAHIEVADHYGIPYVDVGLVLQKYKNERGYPSEGDGSYYYTIDNLHPSWRGYEIYFNEIEKSLLSKCSVNSEIESETLYDYYENLPKQQNKYLIDKPQIITANNLIYSGGVVKNETSLNCDMYGTSLTSSERSIVDNYLKINSTATVTAQFYGTTLGVMFMMNNSGINMTYKIDGGEEQRFLVDSNNFGWQMYSHLQTFMLAHSLSEGMHTVEFLFSNVEGINSVNVQLAGVLTNNYKGIVLSDDIVNGSVFVERNIGKNLDTIIVNLTPKNGKQLKANGLKYTLNGNVYPIVKRVGAVNSDGTFNKDSESQCNIFEFNTKKDTLGIVISAEFVDEGTKNIAVVGTSVNEMDYKMRFRSRAYRTYIENDVEYTLKHCGTLLFKNEQDNVALAHSKIGSKEIVGKAVYAERLYDRTDDYCEYVCHINYGSDKSVHLDDNYYAYAYAVYVSKDGDIKTIYSNEHFYNSYNNAAKKSALVLGG